MTEDLFILCKYRKFTDISHNIYYSCMKNKNKTVVIDTSKVITAIIN